MRFFLGLLLGGGLFLVLEETGLLHDVVGGKVLQRRLVLRHRRPTQVTILVEVEQLGEFDVALVLLPVGKALGIVEIALQHVFHGQLGDLGRVEPDGLHGEFVDGLVGQQFIDRRYLAAFGVERLHRALIGSDRLFVRLVGLVIVAGEVAADVEAICSAVCAGVPEGRLPLASKLKARAKASRLG